ncbi:MAG: hypothetical protein M3Q31_19260 [Actinomycetota bacterium]|nr:hypothetical protein [Actinomycetota bacterium]
MTTAPEREHDAHRYGPAETRKIVGQARLSQLLLVGLGIGASLLSVYVLPVWAAPLALVPLLAALLAAFLPVKGGLVLLDAGRLAARHGLARLRGETRWRSSAPADGAPGNNAVVLPSQWGAWRVLGVPFGEDEVGVLLDARARTASATLLVRTEAFSLLSGADQERRAAAWGALVASLARESQAVRRIAWYERTLEAETDEIATYFAERRDHSEALEAPAVFAYAQLVEHGAKTAIEHECLLSVEISTHTRRAEIKQRAQTAGSTEAAAGQVAVDELRLVAIALEEAGVGYVAALPPHLLASAIRHTTDPQARALLARRATLTGEDGCLPGAAGPLALEEEWTRVRSEGAWHAVFWVARWPLRDVDGLFLAPLLTRGSAQRTVSVVCEPVAPSRAYREAEAAVVGQEGDAQSRARQGFLETARQRRRSQAARERETELADGHAMCRYAGYISVHAATPAELEAACAEITQHSQQSHLELRRLNGQHLASLAYAVPGFCRGLA